MLGQYLWSGLIVGLACLLLLVIFPGRRVAPDEQGVATMQWRAAAHATPVSVEQPIDLAACRELQRQLAERPDDQTRVTLDCRRKL